MRAGIALLQNDHNPSHEGENVTFARFATNPSIFLSQLVDTGSSLLGLALLLWVQTGKPMLFARKTNLRAILAVFCLLSTFIALIELFLQINYFLMLMSSSDFEAWSPFPRYLPAAFCFFIDLRFWMVYSFILERTTTRFHRSILAYYGSFFGYIVIIPAIFIPAGMLTYSIASNGWAYYTEEVNLSEYFLFADTSHSTPEWVQYLWDLSTCLALLMVLSIGTEFKLLGGWTELNDVYHSNYKTACVVALFLLYHSADRVYRPLIPYLPDYEDIQRAFGSRHPITTNFYSLLLPLQLVYLHKNYPPPAPVIAEIISAEASDTMEEEVDLPMVPFEQGRADPHREQWTKTYELWIEMKRQVEISTRV